MSDKPNTCGLSGTSRIDIFCHLAVDELTNNINMTIFSGIAGEYYDKYIEFCNQIEDERDSIDNISCAIEDGELVFDIIYKK